MRTSSVIAASAAFVAGANAWGNVTYTTEVVTAYTTYCPSSTQVVHGTKTYTVTSVSSRVEMASNLTSNLFFFVPSLPSTYWSGLHSQAIIVHSMLIDFCCLGHYFGDHRLPVHRDQTDHHQACRVLFLLVPPLRTCSRPVQRADFCDFIVLKPHQALLYRLKAAASPWCTPRAQSSPPPFQLSTPQAPWFLHRFPLERFRLGLPRSRSR